MAAFSSSANAGFATPPPNKGAQGSLLWGQGTLGGGNGSGSITRVGSSSTGPSSSSPFLSSKGVGSGSRAGTPLARTSALAASGSSPSPFAKSVIGTPLHQQKGPSAPFNTPVAHALSRTNAANSGLIKAAALPVLSAAAGAKALPGASSTSAYHGLVKAALKARLTRLYALSFVSLHLALCTSFASPLAPIQSLVSPVLPTLVALSVLAFLFGVLPLLVAQKWVISRNVGAGGPKAAPPGSLLWRLPPGSPAAHFASVVRSRETWAFVLLYSASGFVLALSHIAALTAYSGEGDVSWAPYTTIRIPNTRGGGSSLATRPNERFFALFISTATLGAAFALLSSFRPDVFAGGSGGARFNAASTTLSLGSRVSSAVSSRLARAITLGASLPPALLTAYAPVRRPLFRLVLSYLGPGSPLRPVLVPSFRHPFLSATLLARASALGSASAFAWTFSSALWEVYSTQPVAELSTAVKEPTRCLVDGLAGAREGRPAADKYFAAFAFAELSLVASNNAARRKAIFKELAMPAQAGSSQVTVGSDLRSGWAAVASECLAALEAEKKALQARKEKPKAPAQPAPAAASSKQRSPATGQDILVKNATSSPVKPVAPSVWDKLAAAIGASGTPKGTPTPAKPASAPASASASGASVGGSGNLWKRLVPEATSAPATPSQSDASSAAAAPETKPAAPVAPPSKGSLILAQLSPAIAQLGSLLHSVWLALPSDARHVVERSYVVRYLRAQHHYSTRTSPALLARTSYPRDAALSTWAAQALSSLAAYSVEEDEYGTVALAKGKCGVEEVLRSSSELLVALCEWGREAEEMAKRFDDEVEKIWGEAGAGGEAGATGETRPVEDEVRALRKAWDERGAPLGLALRAGITLVVGSFEPHGLELSQSTRAVVEKALSMS